MAKQGQKLTDELKEQIRAHLVISDSLRETARQFNVSPNTVKNIKGEKPDEFAQKRTDKKDEVIELVWQGFINGVTLGNRMIEEALNKERDIPLNQISTYNGTMYDKLALMKGESTVNSNITVKLEGELDSWAN
jgi:hypothetical protein